MSLTSLVKTRLIRLNTGGLAHEVSNTQDITTYFRSDDMRCVALKNAITDLMTSGQHQRGRGPTAGTGEPWGAVAVNAEDEAVGFFASEGLMGKVSSPDSILRVTMGHEAYHAEFPEERPPDGEFDAEDAGLYCFGYSDFEPMPWGPV